MAHTPDVFCVMMHGSAYYSYSDHLKLGLAPNISVGTKYSTTCIKRNAFASYGRWLYFAATINNKSKNKKIKKDK